ncbi:MAG TPA: ATP-binding protein [Caulobacteraceae bacterium]|nr:ATP-binding protein [Caulobacteraceae bacterium]
MASGTATARSDPRPDQPAQRPWRFTLPIISRLGRTIIVLNFLGLLILVIGALVINEQQRSLIRAQIASLLLTGEYTARIIESAATEGDPEPRLNADYARQILLTLFAEGQSDSRVRIFDAQGNLIADSYETTERIEQRGLPPLRPPGGIFHLDPKATNTGGGSKRVAAARADLESDFKAALQDRTVGNLRHTPSGDRVVAVTVPLKRVKAITGVLTIEGANVDQVIAAQRWALVPFIAMALAVSLISSFLLNRVIARPVRQLAFAADQVRLSRARSISLPDLDKRNDELGDLGRSLEEMTTALSERMDAIDRFAADVAHEIRNPLTSIRSAVETLELVKDERAKARMVSILKQDVARLDRLITDISNASRLDAELSRDAPKPLDLTRLLTEIVTFYGDTSGPEQPPVKISMPEMGAHLRVAAREGPLSQVFRNLIDNARSFTRLAGACGEVRVSLHGESGRAVVYVDDDGPGIPPENVETVFERFYTSRPKGAAFGGNSGLGLSIAREIITAHSGRIWAENRLAEGGQVKGARFVVSLPLSGAA